MRAVQVLGYGSCTDGRTLCVGRVPVPEPGEGEVLVRVRAAALNGVDWKLATGALRGARLGAAAAVRFPYTPGLDFSGVVVRAGRGARRLAAGDHVLGMVDAGALADYVCVRERYAARKPLNLSFVAAAALPRAGTTALQAVHLALSGSGSGSRECARVLVLGSSSAVGLLAVQLVHRCSGGRGAACAVAVCPRTHANLLRALGADEVIIEAGGMAAGGDGATADGTTTNNNNSDGNGEGPWWQVLATPTRRVDAVVDCAGERHAYARSRCVLADAARGPFVAVAEGACTRLALPQLWRFSLRTAWRAALAHPPYHWLWPNLDRAAAGLRPLERLHDLAEHAHLVAPVDSVFPLAAVSQAFARLCAPGRAGKVVVRISDDDDSDDSDGDDYDEYDDGKRSEGPVSQWLTHEDATTTTTTTTTMAK